MQQSTRNQLAGAITSIVSGKVASEVIVETDINAIASVITTRSAEEMKLTPGHKGFALIKATNVSVTERK